MGSFRQHLEWSKTTLIFVLTLLLWLVADFRNTFTAFLGEALNFSMAIAIPIVVVIGTVFPDIDLPKESAITKIIVKILLPVFVCLMPPALEYGVVLGTVVAFVIWRYEPRWIHWGHMHSLGAALLLSLGFGGLIALRFRLPIAVILAACFFWGFFLHIFFDQLYHEWNRKDWKDRRYALKLWSNHWRWDPFILLADRV